MGPPTEQRGGGESRWRCPQCGHPKFHTMPDKPQFKHRFKCWRCGFRGDVYDLMKEFHPDESYSDRLDRVAELQREFEKLPDAEPQRDIPARGRGVPLLRDLLDQQRIDECDLMEVLSELNCHLEHMVYLYMLKERKQRGKGKG